MRHLWQCIHILSMYVCYVPATFTGGSWVNEAAVANWLSSIIVVVAVYNVCVDSCRSISVCLLVCVGLWLTVTGDMNRSWMSSVMAGVRSLQCACDQLQRRCDSNTDYCSTNSTVCLSVCLSVCHAFRSSALSLYSVQCRLVVCQRMPKYSFYWIFFCISLDNWV